MNEYVVPEFYKNSFTCSHCGAFSSQDWQECYYEEDIREFMSTGDIDYATCAACDNISIWYKEKMVYPDLSSAPLPHPDMPEIIKSDYLEARNILQKSPRGACALLRLALQKLCDTLVEGKQNINGKIGILVEKGLPTQLQKAFDIVRIVGNNAVHPGELDIKDNPEIAQVLFRLINMIIEKIITEPKEINEFYNLMPESNVEAIKKRDG